MDFEEKSLNWLMVCSSYARAWKKFQVGDKGVFSSCACTLLLLACFLILMSIPLVQGAPRSTHSSRADTLPSATHALEAQYAKPIIFFQEDADILVFHPNGDIVHRGRKATNDQDIVLALQEILSLSPCRQ